MRTHRIFVALCASLAAAPAQALPPAFLVADLEGSPSVAVTSPRGAVVFEGVAYFASSSTTTGTELWRSDGTAAGTRVVKDGIVGSEGTMPYGLVATSDAVYFASGINHELSLWKSDGSEAGTQRVMPFEDAPVPEPSTELAVVNEVLFLGGQDDAHGRELWKSDGTAAGTVLVKDIAPGPVGSHPMALTAHAGLLYFTADDGVHGRELWVSDGTAAGTVLLKDVRPGSASGLPFGIGLPMTLASAGGFLAFSADDGVHGFELWRSDGSAAGTTLLKDLEPGPGDAFPYELTRFDGALFFAANGKLWRSDGTGAGTTALSELYLFPAELTVSGGVLYFAAGDGFEVDLGLWRSDGTPAGTEPVYTFDTDWQIGGASGLTDVGGTLYFASASVAAGRELWKSDGTPAGTLLVRDIAPGVEHSDPRDLLALNGALLFGAETEGGQPALWRSDGTGAGTQAVVASWPDGGSSQPMALSDAGGALFFTTGTSDELVPFPLWKTTGRDGDLVALSAPGGISIAPNIPPAWANGKLFFQIWDPVGGGEPGVSDGTLAGTHLLTDIVPGPDGSSPDNFFAFGSRVLFERSDFGDRVWSSDGTTAGTALVDDRLSAPYAAMNGAVYLWGSTLAEGTELWRTDGTPAGTALVKDLRPGAGSSHPYLLTVAGGTLFFFTSLDSTLWKSDGTAAGTVPVKSFGFNPDGQRRYLQYLTNVSGTLFFAVSDDPNAYELWKSDGTAAGTVLVKEMAEVPPPRFIGNLDSMTASGGLLFFLTDDGVHGRELWRSDGTPVGTQLVKDIQPGSASTFSPLDFFTEPPFFVDAYGTLVFAANDDVHGEELWSSDGSAAGTQLFADVVAGSGGSNPERLTVSGPLVYFGAGDDASGRELFAVPATADPAVVDISGTATGGSYQVTTLGGVNVSIATSPGQTAAQVAANLAAAITADATAQAQGVFARAVGGSVIVIGADGEDVSSTTTDVGLGGDPPSVPVGGAAAAALMLGIAATARTALRRRRIA